MEQLELKIGGMHCNGCADRLRMLLEKASGVKRAAVALETGKAVVTYRPQTTNEARVIGIVEGAGFTAGRG